MTVVPVSVTSLKKIKNSVIGNPSAKKQLAQDFILIQTLIGCLSPPHAYHEAHSPQLRSNDDSIRIEAAHVVASLASSEDALSVLLDQDAPHAFLVAVSYLQPTDSVALRSAIIRGLRSLIMAMADIAGPSQWGLKSAKSRIQNKAKDGMSYLFQAESLDIYLPYLTDPSPQIGTSIAQIVAFAVRIPEHRKLLSEWLPLDDRLRESKVTRRGWEKTSVVNANAPSRQGGWLARHLAALLTNRDIKLQEASLWALAALSKDNPAVAIVLGRPDRDQSPLLSNVIPLINSRHADIQLAAAFCATNIARGSTTSSTHPIDESCVRAVINLVNSVISTPSPEKSISHRTKACFILYHLITDDSTLCGIAFDRGCLEKLITIVQEYTPPDNKTEWGEDEAESVSILRESALVAIAAMSLFDNEIQRTVTDQHHFIPTIHSCLFHRHIGVRYAGAQCVRALSRAVIVLRTTIVDSGLGMSIFSIFKKRDEDANVTNAALSAVCNIVIDFSPLRPIYLEQGLMDRLLELLQTSDAALRLNSLWAVKNLLRNSTTETKRSVMSKLGWDRVVKYLQESPTDVQEQAYNILRNVAETHEGIDLVFKNISIEVLTGHITNAIMSSSDDVALQATYLLANIINGNEQQQNQIVSYPQLLINLRTCLAEGKNQVKKPATSCIRQLAHNPRARRAIIDAGITSTLRHLCEWSGSGMSPVAVSSPVNVGSPVSGNAGVSITAGSGRGASPGGRNWGTGASATGVGNHTHVPVYAPWNLGSHGHHLHHTLQSATHHSVSGIYQPHSAGSTQQYGAALDDDKEVVQNARAALDWLERGDTFT
ncbi:hypothetical protein AGABI2DRAFT_188882 [Agaricus bisporus var. bisporus H97]|uniref:hypothetical protein n=1 Tax=Agaricus bisporus var. bisporus (strain H97 / ATCC MYA-4626 / FGSC 10389) TaxID=936046 RepID=UPI00029F7FB5|nr:hypothetical protein AGABI2DRAFT_188882 [Agaricus bisporus var. bisporus H97]EKV41991.1 hypothetical protein AGABI2DRAFT_188882 [Agaricus bisporus var. bisporus H97]